MEGGGDAACPAGDDPMDFSWTAGWEARAACASPDGREAAAAAAPAAPSLQEAAESMILVPGPLVAMTGLRLGDCRADERVLFVNAGGSAIDGRDPSAKFSGDSFFEGGDVIETSENIIEGGDYPSLYSSARYGNFSYKFDGLAPGDYYLDLHFAEIVNTDGPKGIRSFDVLVQEEKILSELDVFAVVGGNRPLQVLDIRVTVESNGAVIINFRGVRGSPMVCGICIRRALVLPEPRKRQRMKAGRKNLRRACQEGATVTLAEGESVMQVVTLRGSNLIEVMDGKGVTSLALFPAKFQKSFWIKNGNFVVVDASGRDEALESGSKIACVVSRVLFHDQVRALEKSGEWPAIFKSTPNGWETGTQGTSQVEEEPDSDDDDLPPLEANTNRNRPFELHSDSESGSDS